VEARESCDVPCLPHRRASLVSPLLREAIRQVADGAFRGGTISTSQWTLGRRRHCPNALGRIRHALEAAVRDSLGSSPAQKHHWAEHLAMPCPACDHECRKGLRSASAATAEQRVAPAGQTGEGHGVGGGFGDG